MIENIIMLAVITKKIINKKIFLLKNNIIPIFQQGDWC